MNLKKHLCLLVPLITSLAGCVDSDRGPARNDPAPVSELLNQALIQAVSSEIVPTVTAFAGETSSLEAAADDFCLGQDEIALTALQQQWRQTVEQWYELSLYNFGPLNDDIIFPPYSFIDSLRVRGTDYTSTVRDEIASDIEGGQTLNQDYFDSKTFQRVGLLALESIIFETTSGEHDQALSNIIAEYETNPRKCEILTGLAGQLLARAQYVEDGWLLAFQGDQSPYRDLFLAGDLDDGTEPLNQIVVSIQEFLDYLQARNVVTTTAQIADHSWEAIAASINAVESLLEGSEENEDSIFAVMEATGNQNEVAIVRDSISSIRQAIADRDTAMLEITLGYLDGNFKREIPDSLDVDLGINFSDGD